MALNGVVENPNRDSSGDARGEAGSGKNFITTSGGHDLGNRNRLLEKFRGSADFPHLEISHEAAQGSKARQVWLALEPTF